MSLESDIKKIRKYNMFSPNETVLLTGFTRGQLIKWDDSNIVKPYRLPTILYDWNQIIVLRILRYWREKISYQKIVKILLEESMDKFYENIEKSSLAFFNDQSLVFINDDFQKVQPSYLYFLQGMDGMDMESMDFTEIMPGVFFLNIKLIIRNLKMEGELLKIENFELKVG